MHKTIAALLLAAAPLAFAPLAARDAAQDSTATASAGAPAQPAWVARSNAYTQQVIDLQARFFPEGASSSGYEQYDGLVRDLGPGINDRYAAAIEAKLAELRAALASESDPNVKQDLEILIGSLDRDLRGVRLGQKLTIDWYNTPQSIYGGIQSLLDDQTAPARRGKALELLQRYTGTYPGTTPLTDLAKARFAESVGDGRIGPFRTEVSEAVAKYPTFARGIRDLFAKYDIEGPAAARALAAMDRQFADYGRWTTTTVLPVARTEAKLPPELYALNLEYVGIDMAPLDAASQARRGFYEIRSQMKALAPEVAAKLGMAPTTDYVAVIAELKKQTIPNDKIEAFYRDINRQLEDKARAAGVVDIPDYELQMRLASPAESAAQPAPHMLPPRLVGNTGERGTFVLTTGDPSAGADAAAYDDFNHPAAAWTLSAHEARPGHELQFAALVEQGVSLARLLYAFNSVNVEGWALYAEAEMLPLEPPEGQMIALQFQMLRAARAFLDPMLNLGLIDRAEGERILRQEAGFSAPMTKQELDRYTFRSPGQAGAYYYGYRKLIDLRMETEIALGDRFDQKAFNDFLLSQGIIPLELIARAVREEFIPAQRAR
ncbi:DUF885 domain-containing protein [Tsuneonella amylolytica]|uniref:DUF885 domain-containing protein n=1 Tax=Tsuneonella amylolytica TaxID=2338327 RepID=UPI000EA9CA98|nr:DUF885 domain-containing protein [Tsuneonella amylolytica]